jgi:hypothetical protein
MRRLRAIWACGWKLSLKGEAMVSFCAESLPGRGHVRTCTLVIAMCLAAGAAAYAQTPRWPTLEDPTLKTLKAILEEIRDTATSTLKRISEAEEPHSMRGIDK